MLISIALMATSVLCVDFSAAAADDDIPNYVTFQAECYGMDDVYNVFQVEMTLFRRFTARRDAARKTANSKVALPLGRLLTICLILLLLRQHPLIKCSIMS